MRKPTPSRPPAKPRAKPAPRANIARDKDAAPERTAKVVQLNTPRPPEKPAKKESLLMRLFRKLGG